MRISIMSMRRRPFYTLFMSAALLISLSALFLLAKHAVTQPRWLQTDDFVEYWAAGKLNIAGGNPYNPDELTPLQWKAGRFDSVPVIMYNPPWMLAIVMPFGAMDYAVGRTIWAARLRASVHWGPVRSSAL